MGQVAQIAEHAGILDGALLLALVGRVLGVRADKGEDSFEDRGGKLSQFGGRGAGRRVQPTKAAQLAVVVGAIIIGAVVEARLRRHAASKLPIVFGKGFSTYCLALVTLLPPFEETHQLHVR